MFGGDDDTESQALRGQYTVFDWLILEAFFERTGYPRAPRYYIMKWLTDWVRELGFDGYRVDTAKHFEEAIGRVRPTVTDEMMQYYGRMESMLTSGLESVRRGSDGLSGIESV